MMYQWRRAAGTDVTPIMDLTREHFRSEATGVWSIDEQWFGRCLTVAIVEQFFNPGSALVAVAESDQGRLLAWVWAERGVKTVWSTEEMVAIKSTSLADIIERTTGVEYLQGSAMFAHDRQGGTDGDDAVVVAVSTSTGGAGSNFCKVKMAVF